MYTTHTRGRRHRPRNSRNTMAWLLCCIQKGRGTYSISSPTPAPPHSSPSPGLAVTRAFLPTQPTRGVPRKLVVPTRRAVPVTGQHVLHLERRLFLVFPTTASGFTGVNTAGAASSASSASTTTGCTGAATGASPTSAAACAGVATGAYASVVSGPIRIPGHVFVGPAGAAHAARAVAGKLVVPTVATNPVPRQQLEL